MADLANHELDEKQQEETSVPLPPEQPKQYTAEEKKVLEFKAFLKDLDKYNGDIDDPAVDTGLVQGLKTIEQEIASAIGNNAPIGLIWQGNAINPQTSVEDVSTALSILKQKGLLKAAQTIDTFDMEDYQENGPPLAVKFNPTAEETKTETGDPDESQQIGKSQVDLPKIASFDDRIVAFSKILYQ